MTPEAFVRMFEEMIDLKIQQHSEVHFKNTPELARLLSDKRETDRRRLDQIRAELIRFLGS
jgi:hypothetical protein